MTPRATSGRWPSRASVPWADVGRSHEAGRVRLGLSTRRAAVLAVVVCALALALAVPLRTYLAQRQDLADTLARHDALAAEVAALQGDLDQLQDPVHVAAEARARLRYVMPGETPYQVQLPREVEQATEEAVRQEPAPVPWYSELWSTVVASQAR